MAFYRNIFTKYRHNKFYNKGLETVLKHNVSMDAIPNAIYIFTVTYNNALLLQDQIDLMKKNMQDSYVFTVVDNSSDKTKRNLIEKICLQNKVAYISLPENPEKMGSQSHAVCLNWIYINYILKLKPDYFGFIDHDIFCIQSCSLIKKLNSQPVFGDFQGNKDYWYLWAGFCFYNFKEINKYKLDFSACNVGEKQLDTGGANWERLYCCLDRDKISFPDHTYKPLREGDSIQSKNVEIIGEWLHSFNGSYWMDMPEKETELKDFLKTFYN